MRRWLRRLMLAVTWLAGLLLVLWLGANTGPGRDLIEGAIDRVTGGAVRVEGLSGQLPTAIRISRLTISDATGPWLVIEDAALDWSPGRLFAGEAAIDRLTSEHVTVSRLPAASGGQGGGTVPPGRLVLRELRVTRLDVGPAVAGHPVTLAVEGSGEATGPETGQAHLVAKAQDRDRYTIDASIDPSRVHATFVVTEGADGLLAGFAGLPDLGPMTINASVAGPMQTLAAKADVTAGPLRADAEGTIDTVGRRADLTLSASAPAMRPGPGVSWSSIRLDGHVKGDWDNPDASGTLTIADLTAAGGGIASVRADLAGTPSTPVTVHATLDGLRVPGPNPMLLANGPLTADASVRLSQPGTPVQYTIRHELFSAEGTAGLENARIRLTLPDLAPFALAGGLDLKGHTELNVLASRSNGMIAVETTGTVGITGGMSPVPALIGDGGTIDLAASAKGEDISLSRLTVHGQAIDASVHGRIAGSRIDMDWTTSLASLTAIQPTLSGTAEAHGHLDLTPDVMSLTGDVTADVAAKGYKSGRVRAHVGVDGPPAAPVARLTAEGSALDAPISLSVAGERRDDGFHLSIERGTWKSFAASGTLELAPHAELPTGNLQVSMTRIGDLAPLLGRAVSGDFSASLQTVGESTKITASLSQPAVPAVVSAAAVALNATVTNSIDNPEIDGTLTADGVAAGTLHGSGRLNGKGPLNSLALSLSTNIVDLRGAPAQMQASGTLNAGGRTLALTTMSTTWRGEAARLLAPAKIGLANGVSIDQFRLGLRGAELQVAGHVGDTLALRVKLANLPADVAALIAPDYAADGTIAGDVALTGTVERPDGTVRIKASGIRMRSGNGRGLPAADVTLNASLAGGGARVDGAVTAGGSKLTLTGSAPLKTSAPMNLRAAGTMDLAMLQPLLAAQGRAARGRAVLDVAIGGTLSAPKVSGTARLSGGDFSDFALGAHISGVAASVQMDGTTVRLTQLSGQAGTGTISASGSVELSGARQVAVTLRANGARLLSSDVATATGNLDLTVSGALDGPLTVGGTVSVQQADIRVPERLPAGIAVLKVRIAGKPYVPPPPPPPPPHIALNVTLDAPERIYIRGRGVDAELGGRIAFSGTADKPVAIGGLHLRRGTVSMAGVSLALTDGTFDFTGHSLTDPSLDLVATSSGASFTSTLTFSGAVRDPKIALSSTPQLPQDEILAQMLFGTAKAQLSPFQVAEIAAALASMSGVGSSFGDPLEGLRSKLGLDQLSVGGGANGPTLDAGRYLARGVRVGAQQSATGAGGTQGTIEVDLAKGLKLETTAGRGTSTATAGGNAASIGLKYRLEY